MADDKLLTYRDLLEIMLEGSRRRDGVALVESRELVPLTVNPASGGATFAIGGTGNTLLSEWAPDLLRIKRIVEEHYGVEMHLYGEVFTPKVAPNGSMIFCDRDINELLGSGEDAVILGRLSFFIWGKGRPLPPGLVPQLLKAADGIAETTTGAGRLLPGTAFFKTVSYLVRRYQPRDPST